jgi:hypothetical protein
LGSTGKLAKLVETAENTNFTPPSPMKATPTTIASNSNDVSSASVSNAGDVMMTSPSQKEEILNTNSILLNSLTAKSVLAGEKLVATYSIST